MPILVGIGPEKMKIFKNYDNDNSDDNRQLTKFDQKSSGEFKKIEHLGIIFNKKFYFLHEINAKATTTTYK